MAYLVSPIVDHTGATKPSNVAELIPSADVDPTPQTQTVVVLTQNAVLDLNGTGYAL